MRNNILYIGVVLVVLIGGILLWRGGTFSGSTSDDTQTADTPATTTTTPEAQEVTLAEVSDEVECGQSAGEKCALYRNETYGFSLMLPQTQKAHIFDEGGGAATITFENAGAAQGFQIFIVPYSEPQISDERFRQDVPSGVRKNISDIRIDGATAASFDSTNQFLGDTHEVWFIHGGYLFEVMTLKPLDSWLSDILTTWRFL